MYKFNETDIQKIYVSSDFHLGHKGPISNPVFTQRGFSSVEEHNAAIIQSVNDTVRQTDVLFYLGDFCLNSSVDQFEEYISAINCQNIYMLWGNHPNRHFKDIYVPMVQSILGEKYTPQSEIYPLRYKNVIYMGHYIEAVLNGQMYILSHFPFMIWDHIRHGAIALCGHSHGSCEQTNTNGLYGRILDCGWDEFKKPISLAEINGIVNSKRYEPLDLDHHI